ncbi:hypothetical protein [Escherichia coli]|nr:hypothetical protein [Escherichia coli]MCN1960711.1 hypothetical protein [Escherichia coli]MCN4372129.1 hypothetical protein [Escherichia coli]MDT4764027.1 hypothetical protein [Escherichia coli]MDZ6456711.1 hypothetical protein [Escherichia coli]
MERASKMLSSYLYDQ